MKLIPDRMEDAAVCGSGRQKIAVIRRRNKELPAGYRADMIMIVCWNDRNVVNLLPLMAAECEEI